MIRISTEARKRKELPDPIVRFIVTCTSSKHYFGTSVAEVLFKEELAGLEVGTIPHLLKNMCRRLFELGGHKTEGTFRKSASKREEDEAIAQIDRGDWDCSYKDPVLAAALIKRWIRELRDPLVPSSVVGQLSETEPSEICVSAALALPPHHRDTLMYVVGLLQQFRQFEPDTKMGLPNLIICMASLCSRLPPRTSLEDTALSNTLDRFVKCLIEDWDTSKVYRPEEMPL
jgi:hypothetical protein